ncbi:hypothetical protein J4Q44_G00132610 [Coregonus suidteri]|uniref:Uncharacterized protein n=1 Tax=Coregonus suidteri TaxID=861788 RepID=A0AAN8LUD0_9TELE
MRMISHIIREIRQFQGAPYRIEHQPKVTQFLLDKTLVMDEDTLYELSLKIEPPHPSWLNTHRNTTQLVSVHLH